MKTEDLLTFRHLVEELKLIRMIYGEDSTLPTNTPALTRVAKSMWADGVQTGTQARTWLDLVGSPR